MSMESILEILKTLVPFRTTEDNPEEIRKGFKYIASLFDSEKFEIQNFEKNGKYSQLISFKGNDAMEPEILLSGHLDVVPAEGDGDYQMRVEGSKAFGRGTLDMKGMVAVYIDVMRELAKGDAPPDVAMLLNGDEEISGKDGAGYMVREIGLKPQFVLCGDGASEGELEIITKGKGILWLELTAQGKSAHGAYLWEGENAIEKVIQAVQKIKDFIGKVEPEAWKTTVNFGVIETPNKIPNKVPAEARAVLDIRFTDEIARTPDDLIEKIQSLVPEVQIKVLEKFPLFLVPEDNTLLLKFQKVSEEVLGKKVSFNFSHGAADIRYFAEVGIPGVLFGSIGGGMHAAGEWVDLQSLKSNKEILLKFLKNS